MARSEQQRKVVAVLWKKLTATDAGALLDASPPAGTGGGAKHIPLWQNLPVSDFVGTHLTAGGTSEEPEFVLQVESPTGEVAAVTLRFNIRGGGGGRREWLIPRQNSQQERPKAWAPGAKIPTISANIPGMYILLIRLEDESFHARVASAAEIASMPVAIRDEVVSRDQGVVLL